MFNSSLSLSPLLLSSNRILLCEDVCPPYRAQSVDSNVWGTQHSFCLECLCFCLQDLCQLVNADAPYWLVGMTEMTRTFGLELLESVLNDFPSVFLQVHTHTHTLIINYSSVCCHAPSGPMSSSVSHSAPGVQFLAERKGVPPRHQALLPQHQVPAGHWQCCHTSPCRETLFSHLHEVTASGFSPHQALLQLIGEVPISTKLLHDKLVLCEEADALHLSSLFSIVLLRSGCVFVLHQVI